MSDKNNFIVEFILNNIHFKYFNFFKKKLFIFSFITIFSLGIFFTFTDGKLCRINGKLQLNPIYTPQKMLDNEFFIIREIAKDFPEMKWDKGNFMMVGNTNSGPKFCVETIEKFEKTIDENYNRVFIKIVNSENQKILINMIDEFFDQNKTYDQDKTFKLNPNFSSQIKELRNEYFDMQKTFVSNNPEKYIFDWKEKNTLSISYLGFKVIYYCFLALVFSVILQTLFDLLRVIK